MTKELGPTEAARFWMYISHGEGDSVKDYKEMWKDKRVDDIHQEILKAKNRVKYKRDITFIIINMLNNLFRDLPDENIHHYISL
ncbi:MAG: hypothetical protein ACUVQ3_08370 [bacterium]